MKNPASRDVGFFYGCCIDRFFATPIIVGPALAGNSFLLGAYPLLAWAGITVPLLQRVTFGKRPKSNQKVLPHHLAPRFGSVCPNEDLEPWAAAMGHPWPSAANPASCRVAHGSRPSFGQRGLTGRPRSKARRPDSRPVLRTYRAVCAGFAGDSTVTMIFS